MFNSIRSFISKRLFTESIKEVYEFRYWKSRKREEGLLDNSHYQLFYTECFGIGKSFYTNKRLLDIGCGPRGSLEWADCARERVGLDPLADQYARLGTGNHSMDYVRGYAESIPYPDGYFDVVTSFNSLDHVARVDDAIVEIARVTKDGGHFLLLTDVNHDPTPMEPNRFGWEIVEQFKPFFTVEYEMHYERNARGLYESIAACETYDHTNSVERYGVLAVIFRRIVLNEIS